MISSIPDYRSTHFEFKTPTIINGEPTFELLALLYDQIKVNAQTVPSTLGGGNNGHLGLVVSNTDYQLISLTPYKRTSYLVNIVIN